MTLPTRPLGSSGLHVTPVGFGAWAIGGGGWAYGWGAQEDRDSIAAIRRAVDRGVNWIDTAAIYGHGHSEEVVGRALRELPAPDRPLVFTKGGMIPDLTRPFDEPTRNLRPESIRREVEASLRRLRVDRIDLYQFHWPDELGTAIEDSWAELARLVDAGKVRAAGLSNHPVPLLERAEAVRHVDAIQPPFSLIRREAAADVIPWSATHSTGVIVYSPMQSGLLTDRFSRARVERLAEDDWRRRSPEFRDPRLGRNLALRDALVPVAARHGVTVAALAAAWAASWPGVTGAIVGARSPEQVDGWVAAATVVLGPDDLDEISRAVDRTGAGEGPTQLAWSRYRRASGERP
ncbi:aldo/keto reductase [Anaeromyxobacter oryzae]|uniref:Aldo/keto reductase n=1 Tax=Anaeromyxobacter oryzae TaxID=2918170 RepID=A0ABN6MXD0_9BACT|nr:aldo/keto reductase [Anaeromyxobacter oryzae]BDG05591.1 aldo/keto reductase [Anaeromyxobacter oryzae]